jgi:hypothetical protein
MLAEMSDVERQQLHVMCDPQRQELHALCDFFDIVLGKTETDALREQQAQAAQDVDPNESEDESEDDKTDSAKRSRR